MRLQRLVPVLLLVLTRTSPARADLINAVASRCTLDTRLSSVAHAALEHHEPLDGNALRDLAEQGGVYAPSVRGWVGRGSDEGIAVAADRWLVSQGATAEWARCAAARHNDDWAIVLVPRLAGVSSGGARVEVGNVVRYSVTLPSGASHPLLVVARPHGAVVQLDASAPADVTFDEPGAYALQVLAATPHGPMPFATWHVTAGAAPVVDAAADAVPTTSPAPRSEYQWLAALNEARAQAGVPPLRADPMLGEIAGERARQLAALSLVAHVLGARDSPVSRLARAHVVVDRVAENVVRAATIADASQRLDASPSHHANRVDPSVDAVGIGVATVGEHVYVVELFAARPRIAE